jgi:hypothetical protein
VSCCQSQEEEKDGETKTTVASEDPSAAENTTAAESSSAPATAALASSSSTAQEAESKTASEMSGYESDDEAAMGTAPVYPDDEDADVDEEPTEGADASGKQSHFDQWEWRRQQLIFCDPAVDAGAAPEDDDLLVPQEGEEVEEAPPLYYQARNLFMSPDVAPASDIKVGAFTAVVA